MRRFHRWLGLGSTIVLLLALTTGLLWAYAPYLYWESGYLEKKHPSPPADYGQVAPIETVLPIIRERIGPEATLDTLTLRTEAGTALYEAGGPGVSLLLDAHTQAVLSPLTPEFAERIARQYVAGEPPLESVTLLESYLHRSGKRYPSVYQVRFRAPKTPEIFIASDSGKILEEQDEVRRFHFWVMRLHQLNFFGFRKTLTIIPGTALLLMLVSGLWISRRKRSKARARKEPGKLPVQGGH